MRTEVEVALIAGGFAIIQVGVSYLTSRQTANDLRANIGRDIEIVRKLRPDSEEVSALERHIVANIANMIMRDERRARLGDILRSIGPFSLLSVVTGSLLEWLALNGVSNELKAPVFAIAVTTGLAAGAFGSAVVWGYLRYLYWNARLWLRQARTWWTKRQSWRAWHENRALVDRAKRLAEWAEGHKAEIIEKRGQEGWDSITALIEQMRALEVRHEEVGDRLKHLDELFRQLRSGDLPDELRD